MSYNELATYFVNAFMAFQHIYIDKIQAQEHTSICECSGFVVVLSGKVTITVDGTAYILEPGVILHVPKELSLQKSPLKENQYKLFLYATEY